MSPNKKLFNLWFKRNEVYPNVIVDLSSYKLKINERNALMYGVNHHTFPHKIDKIKIIANTDSK